MLTESKIDFLDSLKGLYFNLINFTPILSRRVFLFLEFKKHDANF